MLTETVQPQLDDSSRSETDLGALAEHLSVIADALRNSTRGALALAPAAYGTNTTPDAQERSPAATPSPVFTSDIKVQRSRFAILARDAYAIRRRRGVIFDNDELFGEPAWDILLDLYIANFDGKPVSVSSACIGSAAPPTTGLRWLGVLSEHGLILREHDPEDQRRVLVCLTEKGLTAMDAYFASIGMGL